PTVVSKVIPEPKRGPPAKQLKVPAFRKALPVPLLTRKLVLPLALKVAPAWLVSTPGAAISPKPSRAPRQLIVPALSRDRARVRLLAPESIPVAIAARTVRPVPASVPVAQVKVLLTVSVPVPSSVPPSSSREDRVTAILKFAVPPERRTADSVKA